MTATSGGGSCKYCWHPVSSDGEQLHNPGCPEGENLQGDEMEKWESGRDYGWDDNYVPPRDYPYHSKSFILGYRVGKLAIDMLADEASQGRWFG